MPPPRARRHGAMVTVEGPDPKELKIKNREFFAASDGTTRLSASGLLLSHHHSIPRPPLESGTTDSTSIVTPSQSCTYVLTTATIFAPWLVQGGKPGEPGAPRALVPGTTLTVTWGSDQSHRAVVESMFEAKGVEEAAARLLSHGRPESVRGVGIGTLALLRIVDAPAAPEEQGAHGGQDRQPSLVARAVRDMVGSRIAVGVHGMKDKRIGRMRMCVVCVCVGGGYVCVVVPPEARSIDRFKPPPQYPSLAAFAAFPSHTYQHSHDSIRSSCNISHIDHHQ